MARTEILLTSEAYFKTVLTAYENLDGAYILTSLREAQEHGLRSVIGGCLLDTLKVIVAEGDEPTGKTAELMNLIQDYLVYSAMVDVLNKISYKVTNFGVAKTQDQNLQVASQDEIVKQQYYYQAKADAFCYDLQRFLLANRADFPTLCDCDCDRMQANLYSAATCGVFLGGARGKMGRGRR